MRILLESRNNSFVWCPYESEQLGSAIAATNIKVSTKEYHFLPNLSSHFGTFSTIFSRYRCIHLTFASISVKPGLEFAKSEPNLVTSRAFNLQII